MIQGSQNISIKLHLADQPVSKVCRMTKSISATHNLCYSETCHPNRHSGNVRTFLPIVRPGISCSCSHRCKYENSCSPNQAYSGREFVRRLLEFRSRINAEISVEELQWLLMKKDERKNEKGEVSNLNLETPRLNIPKKSHPSLLYEENECSATAHHPMECMQCGNAIFIAAQGRKTPCKRDRHWAQRLLRHTPAYVLSRLVSAA